MGTTWDDYTKLPDPTCAFQECHLRCRNDFARHRDNIQRVIEATKPQTVACLGAGVLNDIPYRQLIESGASLHLVDWVSGSVDTGIALSIIQQGESSDPQCIYCNPAIDSPQRFCRHFHKSSEKTLSVCDRFVSSPDPPWQCIAFEQGDLPLVLTEDVTGGYADEFGRRIDDSMRGVRSWKQAFARATALVDSIARHRVNLSIADASMDLVTSSMLVSQFDHEPYKYFALRAAATLGLPTPKEEKRLMPTMDVLRETLLTNQVERHCSEINRILAPTGRCYMSFELFHALPENTDWFVVKWMPKVLGIVGRHFLFDFDIIPEQETITRFETSHEPSLVVSFVLKPRNP